MIGLSCARDFSHRPLPQDWLKNKAPSASPAEKTEGTVYLYPHTHKFESTSIFIKGAVNPKEIYESQSYQLRRFVQRGAQDIMPESWAIPKVHVKKLNFEKNADNRDEYCEFLDGAAPHVESQKYNLEQVLVEADGACEAYMNFTDRAFTFHPSVTQHTHDVAMGVVEQLENANSQSEALQGEIRDGLAKYANAKTKDELSARENWMKDIREKTGVIKEEHQRVRELFKKHVQTDREHEWVQHIADFHRINPNKDLHVPLGEDHLDSVYELLAQKHHDILVKVDKVGSYRAT